jgi:hypothetical protein
MLPKKLHVPLVRIVEQIFIARRHYALKKSSVILRCLLIEAFFSYFTVLPVLSGVRSSVILRNLFPLTDYQLLVSGLDTNP